MKTLIARSRSILVRVLLLVALLLGIKAAVHFAGLEVISINALFSGVIGANIFLLSFLLSGVLTDFKESERIPGEIASILLTMGDEFDSSYHLKKNPLAKTGLSECLDLGVGIDDWLHKRIRTQDLMRRLQLLYRTASRLEGAVTLTYIPRLKQEHHNLRKLIIRIHTIRETNFISSGYLIATTTTLFLMIGLVLVRVDPFYESLFFTGVIAYLMLFLILLIHDLDNPFGYYENSSSEDVSLKPLDDARAELAARLEEIDRSWEDGSVPKEGT
jgi:hypothetical protein